MKTSRPSICAATLRIPTLRLPALLLALVSSPAFAADFTWDGTTDTWPSVHWLDSGSVLVAGGTGAAITDIFTINAGTVNFTDHDTFGSAGANPLLTINVNGGTLSNEDAAFGKAFTTLGLVNLAGGTITSTGGANANFQAFQFKNTVTSSGASFLNTTGTPANFNGFHVTNNTFNVTDGTLTVSAPLLNAAGGAAAGFTKTGAGTMQLSAVNGFTGTTIAAGGTLDVAGTGSVIGVSALNTRSGGTVTISGTVTIANAGSFGVGAGVTATTGAVTVAAGGVLNIGNGGGFTGIGGKDATGAGLGNGTLTIAGGTVNVAPVGSGSSGLGGLDATNFWMNPYGTGGGTSTIHLDGGALSTARAVARGSTSTAIFNFNGGTFQATTSIGSTFLNGLTRANVRNNGAIVDTQAFNLTLNQALLHSDILGDNTTDGGLTKNGSGMLTLSGGSTFTGNVLISNGTLVHTIQANNATPTTSGLGNMTIVGKTVTISPGAKLVANASDAMGSYQYKTPVAFLVNGGTFENGVGKFMSIGDVTLTDGGRINTVNGAAAGFQVLNLRGTITVAGTSGSFISTTGTALNGVHLGGTSIAATTFDVGATGDPVADLTVSAPLLNEVNLAAGALTKIGAGKMVLTAANAYGGATLVNAGTLEVNGGTIAGPGKIDIGAVGGAPANFTLTAGSVMAGSQFVIGGHGSTGTAAIAGGTLQVNGTIYAGGYGEGTGTGTITQTAGTVTSTAGINFGGGGPNSGIYDLNGGTLTTTTITKNGGGAATLNFNGGTLRPSGSTTTFMGGLSAANVKSGGAIIDTNSFNITIAQALLDGGGGGGLTKNGNGTLTLPGAHTFTGNIAVNGGTLALSAGSYAGGLTLANNTRLASVTNLVGALTVPTLTLGTGTTLDFHFGVGNDLITISSANGLTLGSTAINLFQDGSTATYAAAGTYTLFDYDTAFTGSLGNFSVANPTAGKAYVFTNDAPGTTIQLTITNVASQWVAAGGGLWTDGANWDVSGGVPNSVGAAADFNTSITVPATVTMNGAKTVSGIIFSNATNGYTVSGTAPDTLTLDSGTASPGSVTVLGVHAIATPVVLATAATITTSTASSLTISGDISGAQALTTGGDGTVVLTGTNSYTTTTISGGTLQIGAGGTSGSVGSGAVMNLGALVFNRSDDVAISNDISGTGSVAESGANKVTLGGVNTFTGALSATGGTFTLGSLAGSAAITLDGATLQTTATFSTVRPIAIGAGGSTLDVTTGTALTVSGTLTGGASLTKTGDGTLALTNAGSSFTGDFTISAGTVEAKTTGAGINSTLGAANVARNLNVNAGATLLFSNHDTLGNDGANPALTLNVTGGLVTNAPAPVYGPAFTTLGLVNLTGGTITSTGGALALFQAFQLKNTVTSSGTSAIGTTGGANNGFHVTGNTFDVTSGTLTVSAPLLNRAGGTAAGFTKTGAGTMLLTGVNSHSGGTTISGGILNVNADAALGAAAGAVAIDSGATLQAGGDVTTAARTLSLGAGGGVIDTLGNVVSFGAGSTITGGALSKTGAGTLNLAGTQTYSTLTTSAGTTNLDSAFGTGSSTLNANATTNISTSQTLAALNIGTVPFASMEALAPFAAVNGSATLAVPEPSSAVLLLGGLTALLGLRRRRV